MSNVDIGEQGGNEVIDASSGNTTVGGPLNHFNPAGNSTDPLFGTGGTSTLSFGDYPVFLQTPTSTVSGSANYMKQNDLGPQRQVFLVDANSQGINLAGCTIKYALWTKATRATPVSTLLFQKAATILFAPQGLVAYTWATGDTATVGVFDEEWTVFDVNNIQMTVPSNGISTFTINAHGG